jgi:hypothetical protein
VKAERKIFKNSKLINIVKIFASVDGGSRPGLRTLDPPLLVLYVDSQTLLSGEPRDCSIGIQTDKVVQTGLMFLPELA